MASPRWICKVCGRPRRRHRCLSCGSTLPLTRDDRAWSPSRQTRRPVRRGRLVSNRWWALVRGPEALPVLYANREDAEGDADPDERLVRVIVVGASAQYRRGPL